MNAEDYLGLVRQVAGRLKQQLPRHVELEELVSLGTLGLLDALAKYDPQKGSLATYAYWRIRGAILDGLRQQNITPRHAQHPALQGHQLLFPETLAAPEPREPWQQRLDLLTELGQRLNHQQLLMVVLRFFLGWQLKEAAQIMHISETHAGSLCSRAWQKLRRNQEPL